jgi:2-amino-4-hydroxy-6-hydroxymethyldihydropteridine diphosphokinase
LRQAIRCVAEISDTIICKISSVYETEPVGYGAQDAFLNAVIKLHTSQRPFELLKHLQLIEKDMGRVRGQAWGPRPIDLDVLLYGDLHINHPDLQIPHPHMRKRRFVLEPLCEIAANIHIDGNRRTAVDALHHCQDTHWVAFFSGPEMILPSKKEEAC